MTSHILQVLVDLSCGSGLFTRRFVRSNQFKGVVAADYSETMLQQTRQLFNQEPSLDNRLEPVAKLQFAVKCLRGHFSHCVYHSVATIVKYI